MSNRSTAPRRRKEQSLKRVDAPTWNSLAGFDAGLCKYGDLSLEDKKVAARRAIEAVARDMESPEFKAAFVAAMSRCSQSEAV